MLAGTGVREPIRLGRVVDFTPSAKHSQSRVGEEPYTVGP